MPAENPTLSARPVQFKSIDGYPKYRVSDDGQIQSFRRGEWKDLKTHLRGKGYRVAQLISGKRIVRRCVHHLVLEAFHGPRPPGASARHLDGNKDNNAASNLLWGTLSDNVRDSIIHGTHGITKLSPEKVRDIRSSNESDAVIAERYGIAKGYVKSIRLRVNWAWV